MLVCLEILPVHFSSNAVRGTRILSRALGPGEGRSSAGSGGDGEPVEPIVADPEADLRDAIDESNP